MEPTNKRVTRTLSIDSALVADVLLRLRRDSVGALVRWTLGDHGTFEVDVNFTSDGSAWTTTGRIWPPDSLAVATVQLTLAAQADDAVLLTIEAVAPALEETAQAAIDELAEELLFHAVRAGVGSISS
jgi:hypothetical protein